MKRILLLLIPAAIFFASCRSEKIQEPEYREIRDIHIMDVGLLQTTAGFDLVYYNPNDFGVQISQARGDIYIDNMFFGRFDIRDKVSVHKRQEFIVPAILKMDNISAVKNHRDIFNKKEAMIRIEGYATVKKSGFSKEVPIKYEGIQDIERLRAIVSR